MGMSSSQARLLTLTARMHDIEYKAQRIEAQKLQMANESRRVYEQYLDALDAKKIQYKGINSDGSITFRDATLRTLENGAVSWWDQEASNTPFLLKNGLTNEVYITPEFADEFHLADGEEIEVGPLDEFLESKGCTKEQDKMKIGGETDYSNIVSVTPIENSLSSGTPDGPWGISGNISATTITPAGNPTYNITGTLSSIEETKGITLDKGGITNFYADITGKTYSAGGFYTTSFNLQGVAENFVLMHILTTGQGASAFNAAMNKSDPNSFLNTTLNKFSSLGWAVEGEQSTQDLYNLGCALVEIINTNDLEAIRKAYNVINSQTSSTISYTYDKLFNEMANYGLNLNNGNKNYDNYSPKTIIISDMDHTKPTLTETNISKSYLSKNDIKTLITYKALTNNSLNPNNLNQGQIEQKSNTFVDGLTDKGVCYISDNFRLTNNLEITIRNIMTDTINAAYINNQAYDSYPNPDISNENHLSIVDGDVESVNCASQNDILTQIAFDVWNKNNSVAGSPQEYLATLTDKWSENELASLYSYYSDSNTWNTIMQKIAQGQDISEFLSKYSSLSSENIHFNSDNNLNINTVAGESAKTTSASTDDMQKMLAWSIYNSLSDSEKESTSPEIIYNNIKNNNGNYLNLNEDQLISIFEKYDDSTKWNEIVNKIKNKDSNLFNDTSIEWIDSTYANVQHSNIVNFVQPTPGANPKVTIPTLNDILWNVETSLKNLGYSDDDIETVKQNIQTAYSADNSTNNKTLAYINDIICDFLKNNTDSAKAAVARGLLSRLKSNSSINVPSDFYSGHDFVRGTTSKPHNVDWGKTPIEWIDDPDPNHWHWKNDQTYKDALEEYYFLKSLEGNKFKVIWDEELLNSSEFVSNWLTLNEGYLLEFDPKTHEMVDTNVAVNTKLQEVSDEKDLKKAEAKYEADMKRIDMKDRRYDTELAALDNERNAVKQEMETVKTVAKDNVDRTFRLFS